MAPVRIATVVCLLYQFICSSALADDVWACKLPESWSKDPVASRYAVHGGMLLEIGLPLRHWTIILDDAEAVVAAEGFGVNPEDSKMAGLPIDKPIVGSETFAIDKRTGDAIRANVDLYRSAKEVTRGVCHRETPGNGTLFP
ncbi:MAG TPA: hypothetical protein VGM17_10465 [Rhizomicrobium sp.]